MENDKFWKLLEEIHAETVTFCRRLTGEPDSGDDLYQDSLYLAQARFGQLRDTDSFRSWFYRIVINRFRNQCRGWWVKRRVDLLPE